MEEHADKLQVKTDEQCRSLLEEIGRLMDADPKPGTPDGERLQEIAAAVEAYEKKRFPIGFDPGLYEVTIQKQQVDDGSLLYVARVSGFPHVAEFGNSAMEVYDLAMNTILGLKKMATDAGQSFPDPTPIEL